MKDIQISKLRIENIQNQAGLFSGNNIHYQNHMRKKENKGFGNITGKRNHFFYHYCILKNFEKS